MFQRLVIAEDDLERLIFPPLITGVCVPPLHLGPFHGSRQMFCQVNLHVLKHTKL